jgi:iron transport multicopper oxidase
MSALAMFHIGIGGHKWSVIETDGVETEPYEIDLITVSVAQRFSMYVEANNQTTENFAFNIMQSPDMYDAEPEDLPNDPINLNVNNTVQIVYNENAPAAEIQEYATFDPPMDDTWFIPLYKEAMVPADVEYTVHANFDTYDDGTNRASFTLEGGFQNTTYVSPTVPSIFSAMSMGDDAKNAAIYGAQTAVVPLDHMKMIQLNVHNWDAGFHPFHLHGHVFQVVYKSFDVTSNDTETNPAFVESQANPARRDTITIPPGGMVSLRFRADNPGAWFFHCHIDWHLTSGLAMVFVEAPDVMQKTLQIPQQMKDHCAKLGVPSEGNVVGKFSTTDFKGQPYGPFPVVMGWTPKAIGALAGCIITFLVGFATIVWYGTGELNEEDLEEEVRRGIEAKANKKPLWKKVAGRS